MARRLNLIHLQDIVRRIQLGQSIKCIQRETGHHKKTIRKLREIAEANNWLNPGAELPDVVTISNAYSRDFKSPKARVHPLDAYRKEIETWIIEKTSFLLIHEYLLERGLPYSESAVRKYIHKRFPEKIRPIIRREHVPGQVMEVDFGTLGRSYDPVSNTIRKTWFFSARLRFSRHCYREIVYDQKQETFFACHVHAFERFGGVPEKVTPDNLKAAIVKASFENPLVNRSYHSLARHYGFTISPCLPYTPRHKGGVESDVKYVKGNFLPRVREKCRHLGKEVLSFDELTKALAEWELTTSECRTIGGVGRTPLDLFAEEKPSLRALPATRWDPVVWKNPKVQDDLLIQFDKAFYSAPCKYIGQRVMAAGDSRFVRIFFDEQEIACHIRARKPWEKVKRLDHYPPNAVEYLRTSSAGLILWADKLGPSVRKVVDSIFEDRAIDGLRPAKSLLSLAKTYSTERLRSACDRACEFGTKDYQSVKRILKLGLDVEPTTKPQDCGPRRTFRYQREPGYFNDGGSSWMN